MARSISEEEIRLRKRARRRLIGAIALTTLVIVTLPMVLDGEPRPIGDDIAVQIPSPNSGRYAPKGQAEASRSGAAPGSTSGTVNAPPLAPADSPPAAPAPSAVPASAPSTPPSAAATSAPARSPTSATPADQKIEVVGALKPPSGGAGAVAGTAADARNAAEVAAAARATAARAAEAEAKAKAKAATEARSVSTSGAEAKAIPGDAEAKNFVIQLGAFAEVDRATDRHAQLVKAGVKAYTEVIKTPTGDKTRVRAGPFSTREAAEQANERLKGLGMTDGIVVPRRY